MVYRSSYGTGFENSELASKTALSWGRFTWSLVGAKGMRYRDYDRDYKEPWSKLLLYSLVVL